MEYRNCFCCRLEILAANLVNSFSYALASRLRLNPQGMIQMPPLPLANLQEINRKDTQTLVRHDVETAKGGQTKTMPQLRLSRSPTTHLCIMKMSFKMKNPEPRQNTVSNTSRFDRVLTRAQYKTEADRLKTRIGERGITLALVKTCITDHFEIE